MNVAIRCYALFLLIAAELAWVHGKTQSSDKSDTPNPSIAADVLTLISFAGLTGIVIWGML